MTSRSTRHPTNAERDERYTTAPLSFEEALKVALATRPEDLDEKEGEDDGATDSH